jgi:hypothetical protein
MKPLGWIFAAIAALAATSMLAAPQPAVSAAGCQSGYSYAGVSSSTPAAGISAQLTAVAEPRVESGHVAAWVGVGGQGLGPGGSDEWIQVGLSALADGTTSLYYELALPGAKPQSFSLASVRLGKTYHVAVLELRARPGVWRVWVDGRPATRPIYLPASHAAWAPTATAESWDGGTHACNAYTYKFTRVRMIERPTAAWSQVRGATWFADSGYRVVPQPTGDFLATRA